MLFSLGYWSRMERLRLSFNEPIPPFDITMSLMILGIFLFSAFALGAIGMLRESPSLIKMYLYISCTIIAAKVIFIISAFSLNELLLRPLEKILKTNILNYDHEKTSDNTLNIVQIIFKCCGVRSYQDWRANRLYSCLETNKSPFVCSVPYTCCHLNKSISLLCGKGVMKNGESVSMIYTRGCLDVIEEILHISRGRIMNGVLTIIMIHIIIVLLTNYNLSYLLRIKKQVNVQR